MIAGETEKLNDIRARWLRGDINDLSWTQAYDDVNYMLDMIEQLQHQLER